MRSCASSPETVSWLAADGVTGLYSCLPGLVHFPLPEPSLKQTQAHSQMRKCRNQGTRIASISGCSRAVRFVPRQKSPLYRQPNCKGIVVAMPAGIANHGMNLPLQVSVGSGTGAELVTIPGLAEWERKCATGFISIAHGPVLLLACSRIRLARAFYRLFHKWVRPQGRYFLMQV